MEESTMKYIRYCVVSEILFFNVIGVFGNVQLLWATFRKQSTHSKPVNAFVHTVCLLFELVNVKFLLSRQQPTRRYCYSIIAPYIFAISLQAVVILLTAVDLLLAILLPMWYRVLPTTNYILVLITMAATYAAAFTLWGWTARDDDVIPFCNPPLGLAPHIFRFWSMTNVIINTMVIAAYAVIIVLLRIKGESATSRESQKAIRSLKVIVIIFVFSWYMAILGVNLGYILGLSPSVLAIYQSNMVFFALLCYSQTFYVCIWRSSEYRTAFKEQLYLMICRKREQKAAQISRTTVSKVRPYAAT